MKALFAVILLLVQPVLASETTLREAPVFDKPGGKQIATIKAGVQTEAGTPKPDGFSKVFFTIDAADITHPYPADTALKVKGVEIGKTVGPLSLDYQDTQDKTSASFYGYLRTADLNPASVPEKALEKTLAGSSDLSTKRFEIFRNHFHFRKTDLFKGYPAYVIDSNFGDGLATQSRLFLVFEKDKLVAVIHSHDFKTAKASGAAVKLEYGYSLTPIAKKSPGQVKIINAFNNFIKSVG